MVTLLRDHVPQRRLARHCNMVTQKRDHATRRTGSAVGSLAHRAAGKTARRATLRQPPQRYSFIPVTREAIGARSAPSGILKAAEPKFTVTVTPLAKAVRWTERSGVRNLWSVISA